MCAMARTYPLDTGFTSSYKIKAKVKFILQRFRENPLFVSTLEKETTAVVIRRA